MILIVSSTEDATADYFQDKLTEQAIPFFRFNTDQTLAQFTHTITLSNRSTDVLELTQNGQKFDLSQVSSVWYRRPLLPIIPTVVESPQARKFAEEETYYCLKCLWKILADRNWVSHPWAISWAQTKLAQLIVAKDLGIRIPDTLVTNNPDEVRAFYERCHRRVIVKPFRSAYLEYGDNSTATIYTNKVRKRDLNHIDSVRFASTFFQEEIQKADEVRVTVFGDDVFAAATNSQIDRHRKTDWRHVSAVPSKWYSIELPPDIADKSVQIVKHFGLQFGALDFARTPTGEYVFFEVNPNGQWVWLEIELGLPMSQSLIRLLTKN